MATPEERERESRESDVTKFEELTKEVREEQKEAAERISERLEPQDDHAARWWSIRRKELTARTSPH
jgi:hypothetical protein